MAPLAVASLGGCIWTDGTGNSSAQPTTEQPTDSPSQSDALAEFDQVVDAVADLGCDPTGETPSDDALAGEISDGMAIRFPAGRYRFDRGHGFRGFDHLGFVGEGDATFVPPPGFNDKLMAFSGNRVLFSGIDVDLRADNTTAGLRLITKSGFLIEDVEFVGRGTHGDSDVTNALSLAVADGSETGTVRNVTARHGSAIGHYKAGTGRVGIWVGRRHGGLIRIEDCRLEEFGNNGIYASRSSGTIEVVGGVYRNNNTASVRLSGGGSAVTGATIEVDLDRYAGPFTQTEDLYNTRAIVIEQGPHDKSGRVLVEDCDVRILNADYSQGALVIWATGNGPRIEQCRFTIAVDWVVGIRALAPDDGATGTARALDIRDCSMSGTAAYGSAIELHNRPGSTIRRSTIEHSGSARDGIQLVSSDPIDIETTTVTTTRYPIFVIDPRPDANRCLVNVGDGIRMESGHGTEGTTSFEFADDGSEQCVGEPILADLDDPTGIAITDISNGTLTWLPDADTERERS